MSTIKRLRSGEPNHLIGLGLIIWTLLNLWQAWSTELFHDEAYYWFYAQEMAWGYYDHPPMVAVFIWIGSHLLPGELGVRLLMVLSSSLTLGFLWGSTDRQQPWVFMAIVAAFSLVHLGGFFAAPDVPLILFCSAFFFFYQGYLKEDTWPYVIALAIVIACMLYSKYHGLMVIFFCFLAYPAIVQRRSFWAIFGIAFLLFLPNVLWTIDHGFATFAFHLGERSQGAYRIQDSLDYLGGEWLAVGLFTAPLIFAGAILYKPKDLYQRSLKFCSLGIFGLLFFLTFHGRVEANWAASAFIPLILLAYLFLKHKANWKKWLYRLAVPGLLILLVFRAYLVWDFIPGLRQARNEFHGWDLWAEQIHEIAQDAAVVFPGSYQLPSKYSYYSGGQTAFAFNDVRYRDNQYDLRPIEESLQGKRILFVCADTTYFDAHFDWFDTPTGDRYFYRFDDNFRSYQKLTLELLIEEPQFPAGQTVELPLRLINAYDYPIDFTQHPDHKVHVTVTLMKQGKNVTAYQLYPSLDDLKFAESKEFHLPFPVPDMQGEFTLLLSLQVGYFPPGRQARSRKIVIE